MQTIRLPRPRRPKRLCEGKIRFRVKQIPGGISIRSNQSEIVYHYYLEFNVGAYTSQKFYFATFEDAIKFGRKREGKIYSKQEQVDLKMLIRYNNRTGRR